MAVIYVLLLGFLGAVASTVALSLYGLTLFMALATFYSVSLGVLIVLAAVGFAIRALSISSRASLM